MMANDSEIRRMVSWLHMYCDKLEESEFPEEQYRAITIRDYLLRFDEKDEKDEKSS